MTLPEREDARNESKIWLGQGKNKYRPYSEVSVRQWMLDGQLPTTTLAWRSGMPGWVNVAAMFSDGEVLPPIAVLTPLPPMLLSEVAAPKRNHPNVSGNQKLTPRHDTTKNRSLALVIVGVAGVLLLALYVASDRNRSAAPDETAGTQSTSDNPPGVVAETVAQTSALPEMTVTEIEQCEIRNHIAVRTAEATSQLFGQDYATQRAVDDLKKNVSPACFARLAREAAAQ
jgi:hypothetical protein